MKPPQLPSHGVDGPASLRACLATILELDLERLPVLDEIDEGDRPAFVNRWLQGLGLGIASIADPRTFSWPGPWLAQIRPPAAVSARFVVMYGAPSGVVWDPAGDGEVDEEWIETGYLVAPGDIALARPPLPSAPASTGLVERIWISAAAGEPAQGREAVRALAGRGLEGDRYVAGAGTFPSGPPGSALTVIEAEVCEAFSPPLGADDHRRNLVTRGIALNDLLGHEFTIGAVRCRGMRLCEPCTVVQRYAGRPVLRDLVHRGGLRVDILADGEIHVGDEVRAHDLMGRRPEDPPTSC